MRTYLLEYDVTYSAAMETEAIRAQQIRVTPTPIVPRAPGAGKPPTKRIHSLRQTCLAVLQASPSTWMSAGDVAERVGEERRRVHYCLGDLVSHGFVVRELTIRGHRKQHKRQVQRYRVRR